MSGSSIIREAARAPLRITRVAGGYHRSSRQPVSQPPYNAEIAELFAEPTWSVRSLLPPSVRSETPKEAAAPKLKKNTSDGENTQFDVADQDTTTEPDPTAKVFKDWVPQKKPIFKSAPDPQDEVTVESIRRLLRLSALRSASREERQRLLQDVRNHLQFVRAIQAVDTTGVTPLVTLRDESRFEVGRTMIDVEDLEPYLRMEEKMGFNGSVRRRWKVDMEGEAGEKEKATWGVDLKDLGKGSEQRLKGRYLFVKKAQNAREQDDVDEGEADENEMGKVQSGAAKNANG